MEDAAFAPIQSEEASAMAASQGMEVWELLPDGTILPLERALPQRLQPTRRAPPQQQEAKILLLECRRMPSHVPRPVHLHVPPALSVPIRIPMPSGALSTHRCQPVSSCFVDRWMRIQARTEVDDLDLETDEQEGGGAARGAAHLVDGVPDARGTAPSQPKRQRPPSLANAKHESSSSGGGSSAACGELEDLIDCIGDIQVESPAKRPALTVRRESHLAEHEVVPGQCPPPPSPVGYRPTPPRMFNAKRKLVEDFSLPACLEVTPSFWAPLLHLPTP